MNNTVQEQTGTISDLNNTIKEQTGTINTLNASVNNLTRQLKEANKQIKTLNNTAKNLTTQLNKANKEIKSLNKTVNNLNNQLDKANQKINNLNKTNKKLTQELENTKNENKKLNNTVNKLSTQLNKANKQIKTLNNTVNKLNKQLEKANKEIQTLNNTNKNLNKELTKSQQQIKTLNNTINNLTKQLESANKEIKRLNTYIANLLNKTKLNTTITINPIQSSVGSITTLSAKIKDEKGKNVTDGRVIFKINGITLKDNYGNILYAIVSNGTANLKYKVQAVWIKNTSYIEAVYSGSDKYTSSRTKSTNALKISKGTAKITLDQTKITAKTGQTITLRAKVTDTNDNRIDNDKVVFKLNGKTLKDNNGNPIKVRVIDGEAKLNYTIPPIYSAKTYTLTAVFGGNYQRTETNGTLKLEKKAVTINKNTITTKNNKTTIKATIIDETGKQLIKNTPLAIKINGKTVLKGVNSTNGTIDISFNLALNPGLYELLIISGENGIYKTAKMTTILKI